MKKILFITDKLDTLKINTDTTYALMDASIQSGYAIYYTLPQYLSLINTTLYCKNIHLTLNNANLTDNKHKWYTEHDRSANKVDDFYAVFIRNDPPFDMEYYYLTQMLNFVTHAKVINNSASLRNFNEKLSILNFPNFITNTLVTKDKHAIDEFIKIHKSCVIKPLNLMAGRGVFKINDLDINYGAILETSTNYYAQTIMIQKFIPEVIDGDRRVFIVNGKVIEYCLHRIPQNNQIRGNVAAGGKTEVHKLNSHELNIAQQVAAWLDTHNILFAGLDIIGNYLTEINITSPTGVRQIFTNTNINIAKLLIQSI